MKINASLTIMGGVVPRISFSTHIMRRICREKCKFATKSPNLAIIMKILSIINMKILSIIKLLCLFLLFQVGNAVQGKSLSGKTLSTTGGHDVRVGVILPFKSDGEPGRRSLDFYRGLLLAADHLRSTGVSAHIAAYDEGVAASALTPVLQAAAPQTDLLVGPYHMGHDVEAANFALGHEMPVFLPFCVQGSRQITGNSIVELPLPDDVTWAEVTATLLTAVLGRMQVLVLQSNATPLAHRTQMLVDCLKHKGARLKPLSIGATPAEIAEAMSRKRTANLVVTSTTDHDVVRNLARKLAAVAETHAQARLAVVVQPEWTVGIKNGDEAWDGVETLLPTVGFSMPYARETGDLTESYRHWFHFTPYGEPPADFLMGYDMGLYILTGLSHHGRGFVEKRPKYKGKYMDFNMKRENGTSCWVNHSIRLLHKKLDGTKAIVSF